MPREHHLYAKAKLADALQQALTPNSKTLNATYRSRRTSARIYDSYSMYVSIEEGSVLKASSEFPRFPVYISLENIDQPSHSCV